MVDQDTIYKFTIKNNNGILRFTIFNLTGGFSN
jgi:hypothetical protein